MSTDPIPRRIEGTVSDLALHDTSDTEHLLPGIEAEFDRPTPKHWASPRNAMALRDFSLLPLRDADRDGSRMLFAEDPEHSYDADLTVVLSGDSGPESGSKSNGASTDETEQLMVQDIRERFERFVRFGRIDFDRRITHSCPTDRLARR